MLHRYIFILFLLCFTTISHAQSGSISELLTQLENATSKKQERLLNYSIAQAYYKVRNTDPKVIKYASEATRIAAADLNDVAMRAKTLNLE